MRCLNSEEYNIVKKSKYFNNKWYKRVYNVKGDAVKHYCEIGYLKHYFPSKKFNCIKYELLYDDVRYTKTNPVYHFEKYGKHENRFLEKVKYSREERMKIRKSKKIQNHNIKQVSKETDSLICFLVPELDVVSGGVMSINSIAKISEKFKSIHNSKIILCTVPSENTFHKYTKFDSPYNIYRFEQIIKHYDKCKNFLFHIPETYIHPFLYFIKPEQVEWLKRKKCKINILNQNIDLMPRPQIVDYLKLIFSEVTMTCAHQKYCNKQMRTSYDISVHLLSTSNLVKYKYIDYKNKENLLVYSIDKHPMKKTILNKINEEYPDLKMVEIKNMKYNEYLNIIKKAKWMITFGEGLDGYFCESIRSGTLAFSVLNESFFDDRFYYLENIYESYSMMLENIVKDMKKFDSKEEYKKIVDKCYAIDSELYNDGEYINNIKKFYLKQYTYPIDELISNRKKLLSRQPLISVAVATYNGEKYIREQLDWLFYMDYSNIEIVVSDDNSTDHTYDILMEYGDKIKLYRNEYEKGINGNFKTAIKHCKGEYIALCDQDDIWEKNKLNILLEHIDDFDIVHGGLSVIDEKGSYHKNEILQKAYNINKTNMIDFSNYIKENPMLGCTTLIRKDFIDKYASIPNKIIFHDWWFAFNAIKNGRGVVFVDKEVIKYRQHGDNTSYTFYHSKKYANEKINQNEFLLNFFKLTKVERKKIETDQSFWTLVPILKKYFGDDNEYFWINNYNYFTKDLINSIKKLDDN